MPKVRHWLVIAVALFAAALAVGLTAAHTSLTRSTELSWDAHVQELRTGWLNRAMLDLANLASPVGGLVIIVLITLFFLWRRNPVQACATFLVIAVGWNSSEIAKIIVARHRPPALYSLAPETGSNSFPSGHTSFAFSFAVAVCLLAARTRWFGLDGRARHAVDAAGGLQPALHRRALPARRAGIHPGQQLGDRLRARSVARLDRAEPVPGAAAGQVRAGPGSGVRPRDRVVA